MSKPLSGHQPVRMCVFCRRRLPKNEMVRFVLRDGVVVVDETANSFGRGAYCCRDDSCLRKAREDRMDLIKRALTPRRK